MSLDVRKILNVLGIDFREYSTKRAAQVNCPFCPKPDIHYHCGIFYDGGNYYCFRCGKKGDFLEVLSALTGMSIAECKRFLRAEGVVLQDEDLVGQVEEVLNKSRNEEACNKRSNEIVVSGVEIEAYLSKLGRRWLEKRLPQFFAFLDRRGFSLEDTIRHRCFIGIDEYRNRLIIPVFNLQGRLVSYQARALIDGMEPKYITAKGTSVHDYLYFCLDADSSVLYLVEGMFDAWRVEKVGLHAAAVLGSSLSINQIFMLREVCEKKQISAVVFLWDADAWWKMLKHVQEAMSLLECKVGVVFLSGDYGKDPDEIGKRLGRRFKQYLEGLEVIWL